MTTLGDRISISEYFLWAYTRWLRGGTEINEYRGSLDFYSWYIKIKSMCDYPQGWKLISEHLQISEYQYLWTPKGQAQPSKMKKKKRTQSEATQRFAPRWWEKSTKTAWKKNEKRGRSRTMKIKLERKYCYNVNYTSESSFAALNQGWPSSNLSATSGGNSASLGGCMRRFRDQWSGGLQRRPRAHTSRIQDSLSL